ncbi:uncharacterized protein LOC125814378 [Solanum verrucosum]|uniref:uncharacterized protein LOC125814378 n=1 Tax=Solanum verrucosum TaxID=315347 RepID=UPI0020D0B545|nr:uncharacterized protein LOC125814378 [Solanum verrucosum]
MPSDVEKVVETYDEIEVTGESKKTTDKEAEVTQKVVPMPRPPPPFPQRLVKKTEEGKYHRFITMLKQLSINVPLIEALEQMPGYTKFTKDMVTKKRAVNCENDERMHFTKALCGLGAIINLIPLSIYKKLGLGAPKSAAMQLLMADRTVKKPIGVFQDLIVKVGSFIFPVDFVILDCEVDFEVPIILGRSFLATGHALVDMQKGQMKFRLNNDEVTFNICKSMKQESDLNSVYVVSHIFEKGVELSNREKLGSALCTTKEHHDQKSEKRKLALGDLVLLFKSRLRWFLADPSPNGPDHSK